MTKWYNVRTHTCTHVRAHKVKGDTAHYGLESHIYMYTWYFGEGADLFVEAVGQQSQHGQPHGYLVVEALVQLGEEILQSREGKPNSTFSTYRNATNISSLWRSSHCSQASTANTRKRIFAPGYGINSHLYSHSNTIAIYNLFSI